MLLDCSQEEESWTRVHGVLAKWEPCGPDQHWQPMSSCTYWDTHRAGQALQRPKGCPQMGLPSPKSENIQKFEGCSQVLSKSVRVQRKKNLTPDLPSRSLVLSLLHPDDESVAQLQVSQQDCQHSRIDALRLSSWQSQQGYGNRTSRYVQAANGKPWRCGAFSKQEAEELCCSARPTDGPSPACSATRCCSRCTAWAA